MDDIGDPTSGVRLTSAERATVALALGAPDDQLRDRLLDVVEGLLGRYLYKIEAQHNEALPQARDVARLIENIATCASALVGTLTHQAERDGTDKAQRLAFGALEQHWQQLRTGGAALPEFKSFLASLGAFAAVTSAEARHWANVPSHRGRPRHHADEYLTEHAVQIWLLCHEAVGQSRRADGLPSSGGPLQRFLQALADIAKKRNDQVDYKPDVALQSYIRAHPERPKGKAGRPRAASEK